MNFSFQIDDPEPENKRRRPQRRFHEMAFHDHSYLGGVSSRELVVGGIESSSSFSFLLSVVRKSSIRNIVSYYISSRWASILKRLSTDGSESGPWCCTAPESRLTPGFLQPIHIPNWRSWRKRTRNDRRLCNDDHEEEEDPRYIHIETCSRVY